MLCQIEHFGVWSVILNVKVVPRTDKHRNEGNVCLRIDVEEKSEFSDGRLPKTRRRMCKIALYSPHKVQRSQL